MDPLELQFRHALLRDPDDAAALAAFADWLRERGRDAEAETWLSRQLPVAADDRTAALALLRCRFMPGSWEKRFVLDLPWHMADDDSALSLRQRHHLYRLFWRYRRQIGGGVKAFLTRAGWFLPEAPKPVQRSLFAEAP